MSTKAIREVLERVKAHSPHAADVRQAEEGLREVEAIERMAKENANGDGRKALREAGCDWQAAMLESIARDAP